MGRVGLGSTREGGVEVAVIPSGSEAFHQQCVVRNKKLAGLADVCPVCLLGWDRT